MNGVRPCSNDCMVMQNDTFNMEKQRLSHAHSSAQVQGKYKESKKVYQDYKTPHTLTHKLLGLHTLSTTSLTSEICSSAVSFCQHRRSPPV